MELTNNVLMEARELTRAKEYGILSTCSVHLNGSSFGSVANYCLDNSGHPLLLLSDIAEHTKNIAKDKRCTLTIIQGPGTNVQAEARISLTGELFVDTSARAKSHYEDYFPESKTYHDFHDFTVFKLSVNAIRYIGGFGKIFWISPEEFYADLTMNQEAHDFIVSHMNDHHIDSLIDYAKYYLNESIDKSVRMIAVNSIGIDLCYEGKRLRIQTPEEISDANRAREILVSMAKEATARSTL